MRTLWIVAVLLMGVEGSLVEFGMMILQETWRSPFPSYTFYGCYCGAGGHGQPRDATDRCCFEHDCCYGKLKGCNPKSDIYHYSRRNGAIVCGVGTFCEMQTCECDKAAAICFRENLGTYSKRLKFYLDSNCKEESSSPPLKYFGYKVAVSILNIIIAQHKETHPRSFPCIAPPALCSILLVFVNTSCFLTCIGVNSLSLS